MRPLAITAVLEGSTGPIASATEAAAPIIVTPDDTLMPGASTIP